MAHENLDTLSNEFHEMKVGEKLTYYNGLLSRDRFITRDMDETQMSVCKKIGQLGDYFYDLFVFEKATLVQKKRGENFYEYIAIKIN